VTAGEISARILKRIDDDPASPGSVAPDPDGGVSREVLAAINEGHELAALLTLCLETTASMTLFAATTFSGLRILFPDLIVPLRLMGPSGRLRPATLAQLDMLNSAWQATPGTPERYVAMGFNFFAVTPQGTGDTAAQLTYARSPAQMVADDFPEIPERYHQSLVDYGVYRIRLKEGGQGLQRGVIALNRFLDDMTALGDYVRAKSRAARYDALPFELRLFDRARLVQTLQKGQLPSWQKPAA
jgi:hypothetical protein